MTIQRFTLVCLLIIQTCAFKLYAQNVEFDKTNFPTQSKELKEAQKNIKKGDEYYKAGRGMYFLALEFYSKAHKFNPNNALLNYKIGNCYLNTIQKIVSISYFEKALELNPNVSPEINYSLGRAYHLNNEFDKAITKYTEYKQSLSPLRMVAIGKEIDKKIHECNLAKELINKPVNVTIENLGDIVNSIYPDYSPIVSADGSMMIFTSRRDNTTGGKTSNVDFKYYEDIYISYNNDGIWSAPENPSKSLNTDAHDATVGLSPDGQKLFLYNSDNGGDIYQCNLEGNDWSKPQSLGKTINTKFHESSASFSYDGRTIYFVSDREGGYGGGDIYMSKLDEKGKWGEAVTLGSGINTPYNEAGVFMHPDGKTLYFSSEGHKTIGGYDIFKTVYEDGKWSEPENLGYPINTPDDDVFFSMTANGEHGYYSSEKTDGLGGQDIYMVTFSFDKPLVNSNEDNSIAHRAYGSATSESVESVGASSSELTLIRGRVLDENSNPIKASIEVTDNEKNEVIANFESNSATGKYLVSLPSGRNYGMVVKSENYLFHSENFNIPKESSYNEIEKDIKLNKVEAGSKIVLNNIFFDYGKATLKPESTTEIDRIIEVMTMNPTLKIEIGGHTDNVSSYDFNMKLSKNRARAVVYYLISRGMPHSRMTFVGYGFSQPVASNATEAGRMLNRRVEFKIISK